MSFHKLRQQYKPCLPKLFHNIRQVGFSKEPVADSTNPEIQQKFPKTYGQPILVAHNSTERQLKPLRVGVVFSGGQAPGGHNVVTGLFDTLKTLNPESCLVGFLGGPSGIVNNKTIDLQLDLLQKYRNQGGFDLLGSGRTKIETEEQLQAALNTVQELKLDGVVVIGGDDSNTNAAVLAEYFLQKGSSTKVIGIPKTIDGDLQNESLQISFGFDTACKTYSEMISNLARDAMSAQKYTHIIRVMGRSASHIALECAFATHPNLVLIGEEVGEKKMTLQAVVNQIADVVEKRIAVGKTYGIVVVPEGLLEFIPEVSSMIGELNKLLAASSEDVVSKLSPQARACFEVFPQEIREQLLNERDPHGNVQLSLIETERLMTYLVGKELTNRKVKHHLLGHFFGYDGRAAYPSNFDCNYCTTLGSLAALLIDEGVTGYMAIVKDLHMPPTEWKCGALPIAGLLHLEERSGKMKPVIKKALVDLKGKPFKVFTEERDRWVTEDDYQFPGPIQFFGDLAVTDSIPHTVTLASDQHRIGCR